MGASPGPDGFLATSDAPDYALSVILDDSLGALQREGDQALAQVLRTLRRRLPKPELAALIGVIHRRIAWIVEHERELSDPAIWQRRLALLLRNLYARDLPFEAADLVPIVEGHRRHPALWSFGPEDLLGAFFETHDPSPELAVELRRYQAELRGQPVGRRFQSQASYQAAVQQIHMFVWFDEHEPLDPSRCWSEAIRADLRAMAETRRARWNALFRHIKGNAPAKPAQSWTKEAAKRLADVGLEDFRERFSAWFAPLASAEPQPLTVAGSHVLRGLLRYAALTRDPQIASVALKLLDTRWKAKRNVDKAMVGLVGVLATLPPAVAWPSLLRLQQEWPTTSVQVERLFKATAAELGITEEQLKARALLKPSLDIGEQSQRLMERLKESRAAIRVANPTPRSS